MDAKTPARGFLYGGLASCLAESMTMPLDVLKVRMQLQGEQKKQIYGSTWQALVQIKKKEGASAFFKGIKPAVLRQGSYGTLRIGLYAPMKTQFGVVDHCDGMLWRKVCAGMLAGSVAAFVCTPFDVIKVRMQADGMRLDAPPSYRGVSHAFSSICEFEGVRGLYTGVAPTTIRAAVVAGSELVSYDEIKLRILRASRAQLSSSETNPYHSLQLLNFHEDGFSLHLVSALAAGLLATIASSPFDVVKSRIMSQPLNPVTGQGLWYKGMTDCWLKSFRSEGVFFMWSGFWPNYFNKGPTVALFFILYERLNIVGDWMLDGP